MGQAPGHGNRRKIERDALSSATSQYLTDAHVPLICQMAACRRLFEMTGEEAFSRPVQILPAEVTIAEALEPLVASPVRDAEQLALF